MIGVKPGGGNERGLEGVWKGYAKEFGRGLEGVCERVCEE